MVPKETASSSSAGTMPLLLAEAFSMRRNAAPLCLESVWNLFDDGLLLESRREAMEERAQGEGEGAGVWVHGWCRNCLAIAMGVLSEKEESKQELLCVRARAHARVCA